MNSVDRAIHHVFGLTVTGCWVGEGAGAVWGASQRCCMGVGLFILPSSSSFSLSSSVLLRCLTKQSNKSTGLRLSDTRHRQLFLSLTGACRSELTRFRHFGLLLQLHTSSQTHSKTQGIHSSAHNCALQTK